MPKLLSATDYLRDPESIPEAPIYAVFGDDDYLRRKALRLLLGVLKARGHEIRRADPEDSIANTLDELRSPSLFSGAFALVIENRRQGPRHEVTTRFKEELAAYLDAPSRRNLLVFEGVTWQRNLLVPKRICERFPTIRAEALKPWDVRGWEKLAAAQAAEHGLKLEGQAMIALRESVGGSLARAESELGKLALLVDGGSTVTAADIAGACGYEGVDVTFPLCDAILTGDSSLALRHASKLAGKAEIGSLLSLLALLRLQVVALGRAALALRSGAQASEAATRARVRLRQDLRPAFVQTARGVDRKAVQRAIEVLMAADEAMKSASPDPSALTVAVVARLCECLHSGRSRSG